MQTLRINGKSKHFPNGKLPETIADLLGQLGVDAATIVVEIDRQIIKRDNFTNTRLNEGQSIELVRFVPGG